MQPELSCPRLYSLGTELEVRAMRRAAAVKAFECDYIDVALATSARGARIVLKPTIRASAIASPTLSIDLKCAQEMIIAVGELLADADLGDKLN